MTSARENGAVVITGVGVVSALADSLPALASALAEGARGLGPVELFPVDGLGMHLVGEVRGFNPASYLGDKNFRPLDRTSRLASVAAHLALGSAGLEAGTLDPSRIGLVLGTQFGSLHTISEFDCRGLTAGPSYVKPLDFANSVINAPAGQTAIWHNLAGVNTTIAGGPTAGLEAIGCAADLLRSGHSDVLLAGGAEELCFEALAGYAHAGLLAPEDCLPRPFGEHRNGFALGEGSALLVMEREEDARRRSARPLARVLGHGSAFDPSRGEDESSAARALARAITAALADAGLDAEGLEVISASANGSPSIDRIEAAALKLALGSAAARIPVFAVKAALGEALGASGGFQAAMLVSALDHGVVPGLPGGSPFDASLGLDLDTRARTTGPRHGLATTLGPDGQAVAVVLSRGDVES